MKTNEVLENIKARRSVRAYTEQQVPEEDLRTILEAATYGSEWNAFGNMAFHCYSECQ